MHMRSTVLAALMLVLAAGCGGTTIVDEADLGPQGSQASIPVRQARLGLNQSALGDGDATDDRGALVQGWAIDLEPSQRVTIQMVSSALDPWLEIEGPGLDQRIVNDDAFPGTLDAIVEFVPPERGTYRIYSTTASPRQRGPYQMTISTGPAVGIGQPLPLGARTMAQLGVPSRPGVPGTWLNFEGHAGSIVRFRVTSQAFDTVATLLGPAGERWFNDDANDLGADGSERALDSTIVAALPRNGTYHLVITAYGQQGGGPFAIASTVRPPVLLAEGGRRPEGLAGPEGGGRILGVYAGITDYRNNSRLYGCADDARLLAEAFRAAHLQEETEQLVLPDALATKQGFLDGIAQVAQQARPEDVVVIFYSGHGNQVPAAPGDTRELDGLDEVLVLYDQRLTDNELAQAIEPIRAGTVIIALDACHSGGFADDLATRSGRIGLYSSDEDVLSDVAVPHQAGGYLSWHLRRGVLGEADRMPRDGVLHSGELSDFIYEGFVRDHDVMNPRRELEPMQRLVVRRSLPWERVLWVHPRNPDLSLPPLPSVSLQSPRP
ncbi:MAG: caspase family protein [Sandaracinaceae bacterium]|nr:caspase family protein [Sandaracinaceae bacterium]